MRPPDGFTFLVGGARSGKSDIAVRLARAWHSEVTFIATAVADDDPDFSARIRRHQAERPSAWHTLEEPRDLAGALRAVPTGHLALIDCVSVWVSNLMLDGLHESDASTMADSLADALAGRTSPSVVVSNEVGLGVHPSSLLGREYRDVLGRVNRRLAERSDRAVFVAAGHVLPLMPPHALFGDEASSTSPPNQGSFR